jgi:hypothetical protein
MKIQEGPTVLNNLGNISIGNLKDQMNNSIVVYNSN